MDEETKQRCQKTLDQMRALSAEFYRGAVRTDFHQFIEITGFMNELIKACEHMLRKGVDFTTEPLDLEPHMAGYIGEKFDCIFGEAFRKSVIREAFFYSMQKKGGWGKQAEVGALLSRSKKGVV